MNYLRTQDERLNLADSKKASDGFPAPAKLCSPFVSKDLILNVYKLCPFNKIISSLRQGLGLLIQFAISTSILCTEDA